VCTVVNEREVMVCDVSRDRVRTLLDERVGDAALVETVHGHGTRFTCVDVERLADFQSSVGEALAWEDDRFATA